MGIKGNIGDMKERRAIEKRAGEIIAMSPYDEEVDEIRKILENLVALESALKIEKIVRSIVKKTSKMKRVEIEKLLRRVSFLEWRIKFKGSTDEVR